jgi:hypothetical protein
MPDMQTETAPQKHVMWAEQSSLPVAGNPGLTETVWTAAVDVPPPFTRSAYDIIGLHRVARANPRPERALLFLPGAQCNGSLFTSDETRDFRLYLANRGYEVYSLDYRTHFAPPFDVKGVNIPGVVAPDLSFLAAWSSQVFIDDVGAAIRQVKAVSGAAKVFLAGFSSGGQFTYFYACTEHGQDDLAGLIVMDGGPWQEASQQPIHTLDIAAGWAALLGGDSPENRAVITSFGITPGDGFYSEAFGNFLNAGFLLAVGAYELDADAPSPVSGFATAADYLVSHFQNAWQLNAAGDGQMTNIGHGYNSLQMLLDWSLMASDTYWPVIQGLEDATLTNYAGPLAGPYHVPSGSKLDYLDRLGDITVPQLAFGTSGLDGFLGTRMEWKFQGLALSASTDKTQHILEHFGHLDCLSGTHANEKLAQPMLEWLDRH